MKGEETLVEAKKRKVEGDPVEEVSPSKKSKKNTFKVVDVDGEVEEEKDFLKLSRSQVVEEDGDKTGKKKKKKRRSAKNKPAINLAALGGIASIGDQEPANTEHKTNVEKGSKKSETISDHIGKENVEDKETLSRKTEKLKKKKQKKKANKGLKNETEIESKPESTTDGPETVETEEGGDDVSEWKKLFVCEALVSALEKKGFKTPTPIQRLTLPAAIKGKMDIVGAAETGSGKTLAFGLPIIQGILEDREYERTHGLITDLVDDEKDEAGDEAEEEKFVEDGGIGCVAAVDDIDLGPEMEIESNSLSEMKRGDHLRALIVTPTRELAIQ